MVPDIKNFPYTITDLQKAVGLKPATFYAFTAKHSKDLKALNGTTKDPKNGLKKRYSQAYLDKVIELRGNKVPKKRGPKPGKRKYTKRAIVAPTPVKSANGTELVLVKIPESHRSTFDSMANLMGLTITKLPL